MPYTKKDYPDSMKNMSPDVREKAIEILNSLLEEKNMKKGIAIATAISRARDWASNKGKKTSQGDSDEKKHGKDLHVVTHDDGWAVEEEDSDEAKHVFDKKEYAIEKAREMAKKNNAGLIIHKSDGKVQEKRSYNR